jgi:hypothetical protein
VRSKYPTTDRLLFIDQTEVEMATNKILALALIVVGSILLFFAYQSSQSLGDQVTEAITGRFTESTTWFLILGAASAAVGVGLLLFNRSASH